MRDCCLKRPNPSCAIKAISRTRSFTGMPAATLVAQVAETEKLYTYLRRMKHEILKAPEGDHLSQLECLSLCT